MNTRALIRLMALLFLGLAWAPTHAQAEEEIVGRWRGKWRPSVTDAPCVATFWSDGKCNSSAPGQPDFHGNWTKNGSEYSINWNDGLYIDKVIVRAKVQLWRQNHRKVWHRLADRL